jgi:hypothetical protein
MRWRGLLYLDRTEHHSLGLGRIHARTSSSPLPSFSRAHVEQQRCCWFLLTGTTSGLDRRHAAARSTGRIRMRSATCAMWPWKRFLLGAEHYSDSDSTGEHRRNCMRLTRAACTSSRPRNLPEFYCPARPSVRMRSDRDAAKDVGPGATHPTRGAGCSLAHHNWQLHEQRCGNFTPPTYCCARNSRCCQR